MPQGQAKHRHTFTNIESKMSAALYQGSIAEYNVCMGQLRA